MRKVLYVVALLAILCIAAVVCPPTETGVPPTEEWTPTSPSEDTATPVPPTGGSPTPSSAPTETTTPGVTRPPLAEPTPDPTASATGGAPGHPKATPTPNKVMPKTGFGDNLILNSLIGLVLGGLAIVLWMRRHAAG